MKNIVEAQEWLNNLPKETQDIIDDVIWASLGVMEETIGQDIGITESAGYRKIKSDILRHAADKEYYNGTNSWIK